MSATFPNGTLFAVSTLFAPAVLVTAITNAANAVASAASPPADGSIVVVKSGWPDLNERVARTAEADADSFQLQGMNTTSLVRFPAGEGAGSVCVASGWVTLSQVTDVAKSGGEQQYYQWQYVEDRSGRQRQRPTFKNAKAITLTLDFDDALAWYSTLVEADAIKDPIVLRATLPNGKQLYYYVYPSFDGDPSMTINQNMQNTATFSMISDFTLYAPAA